MAKQTTKLTAYILSESAEITKYMQGIALFNGVVVKQDMDTLRAGVQLFVSEYELLYRSNRLKLISHMNELLSCLEDIRKLFQLSPRHADQFYEREDALDYYNTLSTLLSYSLASIKMTSVYISQVMDDEYSARIKNNTDSFLPSFFYNNISFQASCISEYTAMKNNLNILSGAMKYAKERIGLLLLNGSYSCVSSSTSDESVTSSAHQTSDIELTATTSSQTSSSFIPASDTLNILPSLWLLLDCPSDSSSPGNFLEEVWINITTPSSVANSNSVAACLLAYERSLYAVYNDTAASLPPTLVMTVTNDLLTATTDINSENLKFLANVDSYVADSMNLEILANHTITLLQTMSIDVSTISKSVGDMSYDWQTNITEWNNGISGIYNAIIQDLRILSTFIPQTNAISNAFSMMNIWFKPQVLVEPSIAVTYGNLNRNTTAKSISRALQIYLQLNANKVVSSMITNLVTTIKNLVQKFQTQVTIMSSTWDNSMIKLQNILEDMASSLIADDAFIQ